MKQLSFLFLCRAKEIRVEPNRISNSCGGKEQLRQEFGAITQNNTKLQYSFKFLINLSLKNAGKGNMCNDFIFNVNFN